MGLSSLFRRDVSSREQPQSGLRRVRHTWRAQRLSLGKQLRTLICFTTEEKLSRGGGGNEKRRKKSGSLSQRLRLTESCENQSSWPPPETLVPRPDTCPPGLPDGGARTGMTSPELWDKPSSLTLSSLNEEQLDTYLEVLIKRSAEEPTSAATAEADPVTGWAVPRSGDQLESSSWSAAPARPRPAGDCYLGTRPTLYQCEQLIRRHEQLFGPTVASCPASLSHGLSQPGSTLPEPCRPPEPDATHLSIPQDRDASSRGPECRSWRQHFSSGPDGVWRIISSDLPVAEENPGAAPSGGKRTPRWALFATVRDKCSALFRHQRRRRALDPAAVDGAPTHFDITCSQGQTWTEETDRKPLSETQSGDLLKNLNEDAVVQCTTSEDLCLVAEQPQHDSDVYGDDAFRPWSRFFRYLAAPQAADRLCQAATERPEDSCLGAQQSDGAVDWLPASLWWGVSPLFGAVSCDDDTGRLAALVKQLRPASRRQQHGGLARLVERLDLPPPPADRQAVWLSRPELPQLFTAYGLGPADITCWVLCLAHEREDDAVYLAAVGTAVPDQKNTDQLIRPRENTQCESSGQRSTPDTTPRDTLNDKCMGADQPVLHQTLHVEQRVEPESSGQVNITEDILIGQTDTSDIATGTARIFSDWAGRSEAGWRLTPDRRPVGPALFTDMEMPLCSDVCTFLLSEHQGGGRSGSTVSPAAAAATPEARLAYEPYSTEQWGRFSTTGGREQLRPAAPPGSAAAAVCVSDSTSAASVVDEFDSETELYDHLPAPRSQSSPSAAADCHDCQLRNSSVRPIDSEVDITQVLHEQSGYATLDETTTVTDGGDYQALPQHEVDSETELGLALPLPEDAGRPLSTAVHRQVTAYDSETEMAGLLTSLHGTDSETEMGERLRRLAGGQVNSDEQTAAAAHGQCRAAHSEDGGQVCLDLRVALEQELEKQVVTASGGVTRLPAAPVPVDSETELGVVLRLFEQGLLSSRYFAGVSLPSEKISPESDISITQNQSQRDVHLPWKSFSAEKQLFDIATCTTSKDRTDRQLSIDPIYFAAKNSSRKIINKALFLLGSNPMSPVLARTGSSSFGPTSGLDDIEVEREEMADGGETHLASEGVCDPERIIPEVRLTTSDGSIVVLFPAQMAATTTTTTSYYETEEGLLLRLESRPMDRQCPAAGGSRGFQPTEAGLSISDQELSSARRLLAERCAEAALRRRRRSPSPRTRVSDDGGLRVLYHAEDVDCWPPVSPEGLSGLSLSPTDPELAAVRWRKSSRGEDGDLDLEPSIEAVRPPADCQSQTQLSKAKPVLPSAIGANSRC